MLYKNLKSPVLLIAIILFGSGSMLAQGTVEGENIIIDKSRNIELPEAERNYEKITIPQKPTVSPSLEYDYTPFKANLQEISPKVRALTMKQDPLKKLYGNYVEGGIGNYGTTFLQGYYNSKRVQDYTYGIHIKHLASARGPVDGTNSGNSENIASIYGNYFGNVAIVGGELTYQRDRYGFYGYKKQDKEPARKDVLQVFQSQKLRTTIQNADKDAAFKYNAGIGVTNFADRFRARELDFSIDLNSKYEISDVSNIILNSDISFMKVKDSLSRNRTFVAIRPAYQFDASGFIVTAGASIVYENDSTKTNKDFHVYPQVNVEYAVVPEKVTAFAGLQGDMIKQTLRGFAQENPFLGPNISLINTNKGFEIYGGVRGNILGGLAFNAKLAYQNFTHLPFYVNTVSDTTKFTVAYDRGVSNVLNFAGELAYSYTDKFRIGFSSEFNSYNVSTFQETEDLARPWHRPAFKTGINTSFNLAKKIFLHSNLYYNSSIFAYNPITKQAQKLDGIVDLDLKVDYTFSERFSVFVNIDNILNQKKPRYLYYPTRGILVMLGATYSF